MGSSLSHQLPLFFTSFTAAEHFTSIYLSRAFNEHLPRPAIRTPDLQALSLIKHLLSYLSIRPKFFFLVTRFLSW